MSQTNDLPQEPVEGTSIPDANENLISPSFAELRGETEPPAAKAAGTEDAAEEEAQQDSGLGAGFADEEDLSDQAGLPVEEMMVPPAEAMGGAPIFTEAAYMPADFLIGGGVSSVPTQVEMVEAQEDMVKLFVTRDRLFDLWLRVEEAEKKIIDRVYSQETARELQDQVKYARNELLGGKDRYEEAARFLAEVEYRVVQVERNRVWARVPGSILFVYELLVGAALVALFVAFFRETALLSNSSDIVYLAASMLMGGMGGVLGAWISLIKHIAIEQDFEKQHAIWYYTSPLMGLVVGAFIFMALRVGFISLVSANANISSPYLFYILAFLGGYQHNIFTDMVKRVLKVFENPTEPSAMPPKPEDTTPTHNE